MILMAMVELSLFGILFVLYSAVTSFLVCCIQYVYFESYYNDHVRSINNNSSV